MSKLQIIGGACLLLALLLLRRKTRLYLCGRMEAFFDWRAEAAALREGRRAQRRRRREARRKR